LDGLNRLTQADEGEKSGGSIHSSKKARQELWSLSQTGNFSVNQLNLNWNADSDFSDTGEIDDTRTYNAANEMTQWQPTGAAYSPAINAVGATTDDGRDYRFVYDAFGRLRKVLNQSNVLRAEYTYNGLGYRIGWHFDADADGTVESNSDDPWFWFCSDEQWRIIATYRSTDSTPKERFVFHAAGLDGMGSSSYIDSVVYRDRDMMASSTPKAFREAGDGTLEERRYFCQNWRADVVAVVDEAGNQLESVKYFSYGMPFCLPAGDMDSDGDYDQTDENVISGWSTGYDVRADANLDGYIDSSDTAVLVGHKGSSALGRGFLSRSDVENRKGYAGYENDGVLGDGALTNSNSRFWHVRHRVLDSTTGMWTSRDPAGYVDGPNALIYVLDQPLGLLDPSGLLVKLVGSTCKVICRGSPFGRACLEPIPVEGDMPINRSSTRSVPRRFMDEPQTQDHGPEGP